MSKIQSNRTDFLLSGGFMAVIHSQIIYFKTRTEQSFSHITPPMMCISLKNLLQCCCCFWGINTSKSQEVTGSEGFQVSRRCAAYVQTAMSHGSLGDGTDRVRRGKSMHSISFWCCPDMLVFPITFCLLHWLVSFCSPGTALIKSSTTTAGKHDVIPTSMGLFTFKIYVYIYLPESAAFIKLLINNASPMQHSGYLFHTFQSICF